jgi:hypothetical protein
LNHDLNIKRKALNRKIATKVAIFNRHYDSGRLPRNQLAEKKVKNNRPKNLFHVKGTACHQSIYLVT